MGYSAGAFVIEIERQIAGWASTVEGGERLAPAVSEPPDSDNVVRKHLGTVVYTTIKLSFGSDMEPPAPDSMCVGSNVRGFVAPDLATFTFAAAGDPSTTVGKRLTAFLLKLVIWYDGIGHLPQLICRTLFKREPQVCLICSVTDDLSAI